MTLYIALIAIGFLGFALNEFAVSRHLSEAASSQATGRLRRGTAQIKRRFEPLATGHRLASRAPSRVSPLALTRNLGSHA